LLDIELSQRNRDVDTIASQASRRHVGVTGAGGQFGQHDAVAGRHIRTCLCSRQTGNAQQRCHKDNNEPAPPYAGPANAAHHVASTLIGALVILLMEKLLGTADESMFDFAIRAARCA
jgi:hypothetical protein